MKMIQDSMLRKLFVLIISMLCLMAMPVLSQAATKHNTTQPIKAAPAIKPGKTFQDCTGCPKMVVIYSGRLSMGSPDSEQGRADDEGPVHSVKISAFAIGKTDRKSVV